jgi:hypothetical protein
MDTELLAESSTSLFRAMLLLVLPPLFVALLYETLLGHRPDYQGHYLAGFGGTLGAIVLPAALVPRRWFADGVPLLAAIVCPACIGLGTYFELTIFRLARFDEVDFCNQSLGAALAALVAVVALGRGKPGVTAFITGLAVGAAFLGAGFYYAFH